MIAPRRCEGPVQDPTNGEWYCPVCPYEEYDCDACHDSYDMEVDRQVDAYLEREGAWARDE